MLNSYFKSLALVFFFAFSFSAVANTAMPVSPTKLQFGSIPVLILQGTHKQMGIQYGQNLQEELNASLAILDSFYRAKHKIPRETLEQHADNLYQRFPKSLQQFIAGVAIGSGLHLSDAKILNAMETLGELLSAQEGLPKCAFIALPTEQGKQKSLLIGRNYDYPAPFDQLSRYLTVTILKEKNRIPTAFIALAGEIYCPSCVNAKGLFLELNNGMPSGGFEVNTTRDSILPKLLEVMQQSGDLKQLQTQLGKIQSDYSLIINYADKHTVESYEYSSTAGHKLLQPPAGTPFVSTNFFLNPNWKNAPTPTDDATWEGVTRRDNLLKSSRALTHAELYDLQELMDKSIQDGGARLAATIYQIIFDPSTLDLYLKINRLGKQWEKIPLTRLFSSNTGKPFTR